MSPADLNPTLATIGLLILGAMAVLIAIGPRRRIQAVRVDEEGKR